MESFNIVDLIENNPITTLSTTYQNKLLTKIQEKFTETEQQLFVSSFYCFLKYDSNNDFVIDLDDVWKWVGFAQKVKATVLLEKHFIIDIDYKKLLYQPGKQSDHTRGGHNKEIFMLNVETFKKFCLKAGTKKADAIHDYYIKLEQMLHEVVQEESAELKNQLEQKQTQLEQKQVIKFGNSNNLAGRVAQHKETYTNFRLLNAFKVDNKTQVENEMKEHPLFTQRQRTITIKSKNYVELLSMTDLTFTILDKTIREIILSNECNPENFKKLLEDNKRLKKQITTHDNFNNINELVLLRAENDRLKIENLRIIKKYNKRIVKHTHFISTECVSDSDVDSDSVSYPPADPLCNSVTKNDVANYGIVVNQIILKRRDKGPDGFFHIDGRVYELLEGTRHDVWYGKAYQTSGGLIKTDLLINKDGKIVSKSKSIEGTIHNKLDIVNQRRRDRLNGDSNSNSLNSPPSS